jgi:hypothetical protein
MGKKPVLGLVGACLAGMTLAGCADSWNRGGTRKDTTTTTPPANGYSAAPTWNNPLKSQTAGATNNSFGGATPAAGGAGSSTGGFGRPMGTSDVSAASRTPAGMAGTTGAGAGDPTLPPTYPTTNNMSTTGGRSVTSSSGFTSMPPAGGSMDSGGGVMPSGYPMTPPARDPGMGAGAAASRTPSTGAVPRDEYYPATPPARSSVGGLPPPPVTPPGASVKDVPPPVPVGDVSPVSAPAVRVSPLPEGSSNTSSVMPPVKTDTVSAPPSDPSGAGLPPLPPPAQKQEQSAAGSLPPVPTPAPAPVP